MLYMGCSQNSGTLLVMRNITAPNSKGTKLGPSLYLETRHIDSELLTGSLNAEPLTVLAGFQTFQG